MRASQDKIFKRPVNVFLFSLVCTVLWGSAFPSIKIGYRLFGLAADDISGKLLFAGIRFFIAGLLVIIFYSFLNRKFIRPQKNSIINIFVVSIFLTVLEYLFFYISMSHTSGVKGSIIDASAFFFVVILAHFFYRNDKFTLMKAFGCILGFIGIVLVNVKDIGTIDFHFTFLGDGFMLISALFFAIGSLISKNVCAKIDAVVVTGYQLGMGGLILIILGASMGGSLNTVTLPAVLLLIYMALISAVAFTLWTTLSKYNKISKIAVYNFMTPVFGTLLSSFFLGESLLTWYNILALVLVSCGIYIVNIMKKEAE